MIYTYFTTLIQREQTEEHQTSRPYLNRAVDQHLKLEIMTYYDLNWTWCGWEPLRRGGVGIKLLEICEHSEQFLSLLSNEGLFVVNKHEYLIIMWDDEIWMIMNRTLSRWEHQWNWCDYNTWTFEWVMRMWMYYHRLLILKFTSRLGRCELNKSIY